MRTPHLLAISLWCVGLAVASCAATRSPSDRLPPAAGLDDLTPRERRDWQMLTRDLPAPCPDKAMTVAECARDKQGCSGCAAASRFLIKAVRDGRSRPQVEAAYRVRFGAAEPKPIDLSGAPMLGNPSAPVTIVEFADFQCPLCSITVRLMDILVRDFSPDIKVVFKHFPLAIHGNAELAARAGVAAHNQGRFWEMHHKMFENQRALTAPDLESYAQEVGLDVARFRLDLSAPETIARVKRDMTEGARIGVDGTPAFFVDGRPFNLKLFDLGTDLPDWVQGQIEIKTGRVVEPAGSNPLLSAASSGPRQMPPIVSAASTGPLLPVELVPSASSTALPASSSIPLPSSSSVPKTSPPGSARPSNAPRPAAAKGK